MMTEKESAALKEAITVIYLDDNSDFGPALWTIAQIIGGKEVIDLLEESPKLAYQKYVGELGA